MNGSIIETDTFELSYCGKNEICYQSNVSFICKSFLDTVNSVWIFHAGIIDVAIKFLRFNAIERTRFSRLLALNLPALDFTEKHGAAR